VAHLHSKYLVPIFTVESTKSLSSAPVEDAIVPVDPQFSLFRLSHFCSRRDMKDFPHYTAGNPYQAAHANQRRVVLGLAKECERQLRAKNKIVNFIWVDFFSHNSYGLLSAVRQLNIDRYYSLFTAKQQ